MHMPLFLDLWIFGSVLYAHYIDSWGYDKFDHPESYGLAREQFTCRNFEFTYFFVETSW